MKDEEIKKALACCISLSCEGCPLNDERGCLTISDEKALELINRQQAEIERLQGAVQEWVDGKCLSQKHLLMIGNLQNEIEQAKSEAIKEFAERLKESIIQENDLYVKCAKSLLSTDYQQGYEEKNNTIVKCIDNLLAEMVGEQNA